MDAFVPCDSLRDWHMAHFSREFRAKVMWVGQRRVDARMLMSLREWMAKDAEVAAEALVVRRIGRN